MSVIFNQKGIFLIAEVANSHEGDISKAKKIIDAAASAKVDAIKFQKFKAQELLVRKHKQYDHFKKLEFSLSEWKSIILHSKRRDLKVFFDVFGTQSAKDVLKFGIDGIKIHSSDLLNPNLLELLGSKKLPLLVSTAGSKANEIENSLKILNKKPKEIVLLHGYQGYPTSLQESNLLRIKKLHEKFGLPVGLMDHIAGDSPMAFIIPLLGIALGAKVIEKHITLDRQAKGIDYYSSLNPDEFKKLVEIVKKSEKALGSSNLILSNKEIVYRLKHKKSPISKRDIKKGELFQRKLFEYKRTETKVDPIPFFNFEGKKHQKQYQKILF